MQLSVQKHYIQFSLKYTYYIISVISNLIYINIYAEMYFFFTKGMKRTRGLEAFYIESGL